MSAFCAPAAVSGPVRSVAFAAKPTMRRLDPGRLEAGLLDLARRSRFPGSACRRPQPSWPSGRSCRTCPTARAPSRSSRRARSRSSAGASTGSSSTPPTVGFVVAERGVERLVADGDRTELDDLDPLVVRELLAALRAFLLRGGGEAVADHERVALDAAEVAVDVLDGGLDAVRPAGADEDLAALRVDRADDDRREPRVGLAGLTADVRRRSS